MRISDGVQSCALPIYSLALLNADGEAVLAAILHGLPRAAARLEPKLAAGEPAVAALLDGQRAANQVWALHAERSEEHTSELQSLMRISYAVFCLKKKSILHMNKSKKLLPRLVPRMPKLITKRRQSRNVRLHTTILHMKFLY